MHRVSGRQAGRREKSFTHVRALSSPPSEPALRGAKQPAHRDRRATHRLAAARPRLPSGSAPCGKFGRQVEHGTTVAWARGTVAVRKRPPLLALSQSCYLHNFSRVRSEHLCSPWVRCSPSPQPPAIPPPTPPMPALCGRLGWFVAEGGDIGGQVPQEINVGLHAGLLRLGLDGLRGR